MAAEGVYALDALEARSGFAPIPLFFLAFWGPAETEGAWPTSRGQGWRLATGRTKISPQPLPTEDLPRPFHFSFWPMDGWLIPSESRQPTARGCPLKMLINSQRF